MSLAFTVGEIQTSALFQKLHTNFLTRNLTTGPHIPSLASHLGCINMPVLHTSPHPRGSCMALVLRCDTNQRRWRAPLSCKHPSLLVLFKCLPSLSPLSLTTLAPLTSHPPTVTPSTPQPPTPQSPIPTSQVQVKQARASLLGVSASSCFQTRPGPFHIQMLQSGL